MRYEATTGLTPREALEQAISYFGRGGVGLQAISQTPHSLLFQGGGGHVAITIKPSATTTLELETREWDFEVRGFTEQVSHRPNWGSRGGRGNGWAAPPVPVCTILNNT